MDIKVQKTNYLTPTGLKTALGYIVKRKVGKRTDIQLFEVQDVQTKLNEMRL